MGCCGNNVGISNYGSYADDAAFQCGRMRNGGPWFLPPNNSSAKFLHCTTQNQQWRTHVEINSRHSGSDVVIVCHITSDKKTLWNLIWVARAPALRGICRNPIGIAFQTTSKCSLDPIWKNCILCLFIHFLSRLSKINLDTIRICQKTQLGWQSEQGLPYKPKWGSMCLSFIFMNVLFFIWKQLSWQVVPDASKYLDKCWQNCN